MYYLRCLQGGCSGVSVLSWGGAGGGRASWRWPGECGQWVRGHQQPHQPPPVLRHIRVRQGVSAHCSYSHNIDNQMRNADAGLPIELSTKFH